MPKKIVIPAQSGWDPRKEEFINIKGETIVIEHSLISLHKWESKYHKSYLNTEDKSIEEIIDYIRFMTISPKEVDPDIYYYIPEKELIEINEYINDPMTATTFSDMGSSASKRNKDIVTAEIIYYLMIQLQIPIEFRKWHLNQLMTLIRVCEIKNGNEKKMSKGEILAANRALNAKRKAALRTKG